MKQLHYCNTLLLTGIGLLFVTLTNANTSDENDELLFANDPASSSLLSSEGSRHRLALHRTSRRELLMESLRNIDYDEDELIDEEDDSSDDDEEDEVELDGDTTSRLLQKKKKNNKKKRKKARTTANKKKKDNTIKKQKEKKEERDSFNRKDSNKKKRKNGDKKRKGRKDAYYKQSSEWCLCEDLYGSDYWGDEWGTSMGWNEDDDDYDDDYFYADDDDDDVYYISEYKGDAGKKKKRDDRVLLDGEDGLESTFSRDVVDPSHELEEAEEFIDESESKSLAEEFTAAEDEEVGGIMTMLRFKKKKRQNRKSNNRNKKRANRKNNGGRGNGRKSNNGRQSGWGSDRGDWNDFEDDDDDWSGGEWREPRDKWCPCPFVPEDTDEPTYAPTAITLPPTLSPSHSPTVEPTMYPTVEPTHSPSMEPTPNPTPRPSKRPTHVPTPRPSQPPSPNPTKSPTTEPVAPTQDPSVAPSSEPTRGGSPVQSLTGYFWGSRTGIGGPLGQTQATAALFNGGQRISSIAAGQGYTLYVDVDGNAYASGSIALLSAYRGQFGVGNDVMQGSNVDRPITNVVGRIGVGRPAPRFESVYAGRDHSAFIDRSGRLYTAGSNSGGKLCLGDNSGDKDVPHLVSLPPKSVAVSVALGLEFTLILLDNGEVYGCGSNSVGQIGLGNTESVSEPTLIGERLGRIKAISAGGDFGLYLTESGRAYSSGGNLYNQQCSDTDGIPIRTLTEVDVQGLSVIEIQGGRAASYLVLTDGSSLPAVASCGRNDEGQLCGNSVNGRAQVIFDESVRVTEIGSGSTAQTVFFLGVDTANGSDVAYGCGANVLNQVGIGSNQPPQVNLPRRLNLFGSRNFNIDIFASSSHTLAIGSIFSSPPTPPPTGKPSSAPTNAPSSSPSKSPTNVPTNKPVTNAPTSVTKSPTPPPSNSPTNAPSPATGVPTPSPTTGQPSPPTQPPSPGPSTSQPSPVPTQQPTKSPTPQPSTATPTNAPSPAPTNAPSRLPTSQNDARITDVDTLTPQGTAERFQFGRSVAISGTNLLVGAPDATDVDSDDNDVPLGAGYYFTSLTSNGSQTKVISGIGAPAPTPPNLSYSCGSSVALSENYAVIGCPGFREFSGGTYLTNQYGAVAVFRTDTIPASPLIITYDGPDPARFGSSVSINAAGFLAVGSRRGTVTLYNVSPGQQPNRPIRELQPGLNPLEDNYGWSVALNDDNPPMLAVGAIAQNGGEGVVYLYRNINISPEVISAPAAATENCDSSDGCGFGFSVAFSGKTLVVGSPYTRSRSGRAFVYDLTLDDFEDQVQSLPANPPDASLFGRSVAISDEAIVVGSRGYSRNGDTLGAAFFFNRNSEGVWFAPSFGDDNQNPVVGSGDQFGNAVAIGSTAFVVGVPNDSTQRGKVVSYSYESAGSSSSANNAIVAENRSARDDFTELQLSDDCTLAYKLMPWDAVAISIELTCEGVEEWVGIGFSSDGLMENSVAVIGIPGNDAPLLYALDGKSTNDVVPLPVEEQTLIDTSLETDSDGRTVMKFTHILEKDTDDEIYVLYARGTTATLGYHAERSSVQITL